jgi:hypothetical protein
MAGAETRAEERVGAEREAAWAVVLGRAAAARTTVMSGAVM